MSSTGDGMENEALVVLRRLSREQNFVDFDDLIALTVELLASRNTSVRLKVPLADKLRHAPDRPPW